MAKIIPSPSKDFYKNLPGGKFITFIKPPQGELEDRMCRWDRIIACSTKVESTTEHKLPWMKSGCFAHGSQFARQNLQSAERNYLVRLLFDVT